MCGIQGGGYSGISYSLREQGQKNNKNCTVQLFFFVSFELKRILVTMVIIIREIPTVY